MVFRKRTTKPCRSDFLISFYNNSKNGGKSSCVTGNKTDQEANVLRNCVGYACGRFNEIIAEVYGVDSMMYQLNTDAERFISQAKSKGLEVSAYPQPGAIMVWQKGAINHADGAGHVAIVERVLDNDYIFTSESGWTSPVFGNKYRRKGSGNWGQSSLYTFKGFIINPAISEMPAPIPDITVKKGMKCSEVKWLQKMLNHADLMNNLAVDGSCGAKTDAALRAFQQTHGLAVDGKCGAKTRQKLLEVWQDGN